MKARLLPEDWAKAKKAIETPLRYFIFVGYKYFFQVIKIHIYKYISVSIRKAILVAVFAKFHHLAFCFIDESKFHVPKPTAKVLITYLSKIYLMHNSYIV